jgi:hypothetical protein
MFGFFVTYKGSEAHGSAFSPFVANFQREKKKTYFFYLLDPKHHKKMRKIHCSFTPKIHTHHSH